MHRMKCTIYKLNFALYCYSLSAHISRFNAITFGAIQFPAFKTQTTKIVSFEQIIILYSNLFTAFDTNFLSTPFSHILHSIRLFPFDAFWLFCLFSFGFAYAKCSVIMYLKFTWLNAFSLQTVIHSLNWWKSPNTSDNNYYN